MSTRTRPQQRSSTQSRFGRPGTSAPRRRASSARSRPLPAYRRGSSQGSGKGGQALQALTGMLAARSGKKASRGAGKGAKAGAGVAMLTAAAGLAFKNRDKLTSMLKRDGGRPETDASAPPAGTTGSAVHPVTSPGSTGTMNTPGSGLGTSGTATSPLDTPATSLGGTGSGSSLDTPSTSLGGTGTSSSTDPTTSSPLDADRAAGDRDPDDRL